MFLIHRTCRFIYDRKASRILYVGYDKKFNLILTHISYYTDIRKASPVTLIS